ncbi:unnamed protein product [Camellia sinensis]
MSPSMQTFYLPKLSPLFSQFSFSHLSVIIFQALHLDFRNQNPPILNNMKKSGILAAASVAAASATVISSPPSSSTLVTNSKSQRSREGVSSDNSENSRASSDKFAPRFDGLRFIETLVTAHR